MGIQGSAKVDSMAECVPFVTAKEITKTCSGLGVGILARKTRGRRKGARRGRTIEKDDIANIGPDFLRLEDHGGILIGAISANEDGYRPGRGQ